jgi:hypothetical protein
MRCGAPLAGGRDPQAPEPQLDHDVETVTRYAFERVDAGLPMPA